MRRREFLELATAAAAGRSALARGVADRPLPPLPRVNGGINVQPLRLLDAGPPSREPIIEPALVDLQMRAVYELGFEQLRVTISFNRFAPDFFAAIPYVRAARALGIDVVGVMSDFAGYSLVQALAVERSAVAVHNTYRDIFVLQPVEPAPGVERLGEISLQVLNEPTHFLGIPPDRYVQDFLRPLRGFFALRSPELKVVSAAEIGNVEGIQRVRAMLEAGLEAHCDRVAYHVYSRRLTPLLSGLVRRPVWITESGADRTEDHLGWVEQAFPELRARVPEVERIFFYVLFDRAPGRFRLLDISGDAASGYAARAESRALVERYARRVAQASGGVPRASYAELVPDITAYFPRPFDVDRVVEASPFLPPT